MREEILNLLSMHLPGPFKFSGVNIVCPCPFHKDGQERTPSFGVNFQTGAFNCFSCHVNGGLYKLLEMLGMSRDAAVSALKHIQPFLEKSKEKHRRDVTHFFEGRDPFKAKQTLPETITGIFEWMPLQLVQKGFDPLLLKELEIGFDKNKNRIMYPLRDLYGSLVGFSGGATSKEQLPKYKIYQGGHKKGTLWVEGDFGKWFDDDYPGYRCENHELIWNMHRVIENKSDTIYVAEGFKACMWLIQAGFTNTVALMGSYVSETQQRLLHRHGGNVVLCLDNDEPGRAATQKIGHLLWEPFYGKVKAMRYPEGHNKTQPDDYTFEQIHEMVLNAVQVQPPPRRQRFNSSENTYANDVVSS